MASCPDRETFDRYKYCISTSAATYAPEVEKSTVTSVEPMYGLSYEDEETWDSVSIKLLKFTSFEEHNWITSAGLQNEGL